MNSRRVVAALVSGCLVYAVGAAVSGYARGRSRIVDALRDPVPAAAADPTSGSRLKPKFMVSSDGSKQFLPDVMYDSERDEDCWYAKAGDGELRCTPLDAGDSGIFYRDSQCTDAFTAFGAPQPGCPAKTTRYVRFYDGAPVCGYTSNAELNKHLYPVGPQISPPAQWFYKPDPNTCAPQPASNVGVFHSLLPEVPASAFVKGTPGTAP